jgi:purine-binding chemotaxis protein CheW
MNQAATLPVPSRTNLPVVHTGAEHGQYLIFTLSGEAFAIDILHVKEIIEYGQLTEVPMMPEVVRGVINLRGAVVPVIDLSARFGRAPTQVGRRTCIAIVELKQEGERHDVGIIVDAVNEVVEIPPADIEPPPSFGTPLRTDFIAGMGKLEGKFVIMLSGERVLCLDELSMPTPEVDPEAVV